MSTCFSTRRARLGAAVVAALLLSGVTAVTAGPLAPLPAVAAATGPTTYDEKIAATALLGMEADPLIVGYDDRGFVFQISQFADQKGYLAVRQDALFALQSDATDPDGTASAAFIRTGIAKPLQEDRDRIIAEGVAAQKEREARRAAGAEVGWEVTENDYVLTELAFIVRLRSHTADWQTQIRAAADAAAAGTVEMQQQFVATVVHTAAAADAAAKIMADQEAEAEAKAAAANRLLKTGIARAMGMPVTDELVNLPDRNFISSVHAAAVEGSEIYLSAEDAVLSNDPADWTEWITTGFQSAQVRDLAIQAAKAASERRAAVAKIAATEYPDSNVRRAAQVALASGDDDVIREFLYHGQFEVNFEALLQSHEFRNWDMKNPNDRAVAFDYDHTGKQDFLLLYRPGSGTIFIFRRAPGDVWSLANSDPFFGDVNIKLDNAADRIVPYDWDSTGKLDDLLLLQPALNRITILTQDGGHYTKVYQGTGMPGLPLPAQILNDPVSATSEIVALDCNHTGKQDCLAISHGQHRSVTGGTPSPAGVHVLRRRSSSDLLPTNGFVRAAHFTTEGTDPSKLFALDVDHTGNVNGLGVYLSGSASQAVTIYRQSATDATYTAAYTSPAGIGPAGGMFDLKDAGDTIMAYDYDHSGKQDALLVFRPSTNIQYVMRHVGAGWALAWAGRGLGGFGPGSASSRFTAWDYDHTGRLDVLFGYRPGQTGTNAFIIRRPVVG